MEHFTRTLYWGTADELNYISQGLYSYTMDKFNTLNAVNKLAILESLAHMYEKFPLREIMNNLNHFQPYSNHTCTMGVISPFTSRLELITIPCDKQYNIASVICQKSTQKENKV